MTSQSVAEIVAETMNNYLLMGHLLKCQVSAQMCAVGEEAHVQIIPQDEVHEKLWEGANKKFRKVPRARVEQARHERVSTDTGCEHASALTPDPDQGGAGQVECQGVEQAGAATVQDQGEGYRLRVRGACECGECFNVRC